MTLNTQLTKFKFCQYQIIAILPNLMLIKVTHYTVYGHTIFISNEVQLSALWSKAYGCCRSNGDSVACEWSEGGEGNGGGGGGELILGASVTPDQGSHVASDDTIPLFRRWWAPGQLNTLRCNNRHGYTLRKTTGCYILNKIDVQEEA